MMNNTDFNPKAAYGVIKKIFYAILVSPLIFLLLAIYVSEGASPSAFDMQEPLNLALIVMTLLIIPAGSFVMRKIFSSVKPEHDTRKRMEIFQRGWMVRLATYEGVELFSIVVFLITGNILVLLFAAVSFLGIATSYPRPSYIRQTVGINEAELL